MDIPPLDRGFGVSNGRRPGRVLVHQPLESFPGRLQPSTDAGAASSVRTDRMSLTAAVARKRTSCPTASANSKAVGVVRRDECWTIGETSMDRGPIDASSLGRRGDEKCRPGGRESEAARLLNNSGDF
jgi:hypothetical protein